jgi:hypothetical protein
MNQQKMQPAPAGLMVQQQIMHPACATNPPMARTASTKPKIQRMSEADLISRTNVMTGPHMGNTAAGMASSGN